MTPYRDRTRREAGFTLVELLIGVVLLAMITGALSGAFVTAFRGVPPTNERVQESNDSQVIAAYLVRDGQSAGGTNPTSGTGDPSLGVSSPGAAPDCSGPAGTVVLRFKWRDFFASNTSHLHVANYFFDATQHQIVRQTCVDGAVESVLTLANSVFSVDSGATPIPANNAAACIAADGSEATCPTSPASQLPDRVRIRVTETNSPVNSPTPYVFTLTASVRPTTPSSAPDSSNANLIPLLLLGGCGSTPPVDMQGSPDVVVYGGVAANNGCVNPTVSLQPGATFVSTGGVTVGSFADPYATLAPPAVDCSTNTGSGGPGTYTTTPTFKNVTLAPGIYVFCNGVTLQNSVTANGVLFYIVGGTFNGSQADITMSSPTTGPYGSQPGGANLTVWQAASDSTQMVLCCSNTANATFNGTIYAPTATVQLKNADMTLTQVVAYSVLFGPGGGTHSTVIGNKPAVQVHLATTSLPAWTVNRPYPAATKLTGTGGSGGYTYSATGLPPGLSVDPVSGVISGTPTAAATYTVHGGVTDSIGEQDFSNPDIVLLINAPPTISGPLSLPNWTINRAYPGTALVASNGTPDPVTGYAWSAMNMPPGLTVDTNGVVSGTPTATGTFTPTFTVLDMTGASATRQYTITINSPPRITGPATLPDWTVGQAYPNPQITTVNGTGPFTWTQSGLPNGLSINAAGRIVGTPTVNGTFAVTITLHDAAGATDAISYTVHMNLAPGIADGSLTNGEQGVAYSYTLTPVPGTPPYTWSATGLPAGLTLDAASGTISGTPTVSFNGNVNVTVKDAANATTTKALSLVIAAPVTITPTITLQPWTVNRNYPGLQMTASGGKTAYAWSATGLPPGMNINGSGNGIISGNPSATGTFSVVVTVTDALGATSTKTYSLVINSPPTISTGSLPDGERTVGYNSTVVAAGGTAGATSSGYTWAASGLPNGLTIDGNSGVISGTPTQAGPFSITVTATDGAGAPISATFNVNFTDAPSITGPGTLPNGTVGAVYPGATIVNAGGKGPFTWSATGMPPGLTIDSTGAISGIPTAAGTFTPTITVKDSFNATASHSYTIIISGTPTITTTGLPSSTVNQPYNFSVAETGGTGSLTWSASGLPAGVTINPSSGVISGTPTVTGPYTVTINLSDSLGATATPATFSFSITDPPSISTTSLPDGVQGSAYNVTLTGASGTTPYVWTATGLPAGLTISSGGLISGTPSATGTSTVNITLTDASNAPANASLTLRVNSGMSLSATTLQPWTVNSPYPTTTITATGGTGSYSWNATGLPAGMSINSGTGAISGTPTATVTNATVTVTATDTASPPQARSRNYSLTINPAPSLTTTSCIAQQNKPFSLQLATSGGTGAITWSLSGQPASVAVSPTTGWLAGTAPAASGPYPFTITVTDAAGATSNATFTLTVQNGSGGTTC
jgi:hypothetical protein